MANKLEGMDKVLDNLNVRISAIENKSVASLFKSGLKVQRLSQERVPVEYGNLRASAYTRKAIGEPNTIEIGFGAAYAVYVHENMEQKLKGQKRQSGLGVYWGPQGQPKFLQSALEDLQDQIVSDVAADAKVDK